jgi:hypothetical protein
MRVARAFLIFWRLVSMMLTPRVEGFGFRGEIGFHNPKSMHEGNHRSVYDIEGALTGKLFRLDPVQQVCQMHRKIISQY